MKKFMKRFLLLLLALILGYLAFNQIDARPYRSQLLDLPVLGPEAFEKTNCFYRLWTLTEPKDVDIESDAVILPYRRLFDPSFGNDRFIKEFIQNREAYLKKGEFPNDFIKMLSVMRFGVERSRVLEQYQERLRKAREEYGFLLARYDKMIACDRFIDLTLVRKDAPITSFRPWLLMARFFMALDIIMARNGNALEAAAHILKQLRFAIEVNAKSRPLLTNLIAKAVARTAIWSLIDIMNQKDCPLQVFQLVYEKTELLMPDQYGSRFPLLFDAYLPPNVEYFRKNWFSTVKNRLLYQENRTRNIRIRYMESFIPRAETPPYQWSGDFQDLPRQAQGSFWWLQNSSGKQELDAHARHSYIRVVYKCWALKTEHDMLHIAADLHRNFNPARSVQSQLNGLPSYRELLDPCSGEPYIWNEAKKLLYSIGIDRRDNQGENKDWLVYDSDYALPVITNFK